MVTTPTHGYVSDGSQSVMYSVLSNDSGVTDITSNIYDGDPARIASKYGYPFIIIKPPVHSQFPITQVHWNNTVNFNIVIRSKSESVLRQLYDAVIKSVVEGEQTFITNNMYNPEFLQPTPDDDIDGSVGNFKTVYGLNVGVIFDVFTAYYPTSV